MKKTPALAAALLFIVGAAIPAVTSGTTGVSAAGSTRLIPSGGTTSIRAAANGPDSPQQPEISPHAFEADRGAGTLMPGVNPSIFPNAPLPTPNVKSSRLANANPGLALSFDGLNHRQQRLANGGNQFSLEPPDQALCVGNGFTVESVNSVLRVYDSNTGAPMTGVEDLNTFFGYAPAIIRATGAQGPDVIDPICHFDPDNGRFIVAITTLHHVGTTRRFSGKNTIDVAVSNTTDPTGNWTIYSVPAQNDGTDGTPDHGCTTDGVTPGAPCFQDYPHIGADKNGVYITTNEYDLFGPSFHGAQIFAFSKAQLAAHPASVAVTLVQSLNIAGSPGFTVWPTTSQAGQYSPKKNGTEFFMSTIAGDGSETGNPTGTNNRIAVWALSNTASLNSATPGLQLTSTLLKSETYVFPPLSNQKPGSTPLRDCLADTTLATPFGPGCWQFFFNPPQPAPEVESSPDSSDTRMQQTWFVDGTIWGAASTGVRVAGKEKAGIAWFAVTPDFDDNGNLTAEMDHQGYLALAGNNLTYPALAMGANGKGAIAFSVMGNDFYPSAGYASISSDGEVGALHIAGAGLGPTDGFTSYAAFVGNPPRTRWGDYGAAVTDGNSIWMASEYISQTCTFAQYTTGALGSCGGTRTAFGNWATRITKLNP